MKTIKLSEAAQALAEYAACRRDEVVVLTERNLAVAALVPLKPADRESLALSSHPEFLDLIERSRAEFRHGRTLSFEEMKQEFPSRRSPDKALQPTSRARRTTKSRKRTRAARG